jgi:hypothetical protein
LGRIDRRRELRRRTLGATTEGMRRGGRGRGRGRGRGDGSDEIESVVIRECF